MELETRRLLLRPFRAADLRDLHEYSSQPGVGEMAGWRHHGSVDESRRVLERYPRNPDIFAVEHRESGKVIGHIAAHPDSENGRADTRELGFVLHRDYQRRGLMAEAVGKLLEYLPTRGVRHIDACCFQENEPSRRLIEKCGFVLEGEGTYDSKSLDRTFPSYEYVYEART